MLIAKDTFYYAHTLHSVNIALQSNRTAYDYDHTSTAKTLNALTYFAERINALTFQKAIQLLYLADEYAVRKSGAPITWLDYHVWKSGPVVEDLLQLTNLEQDLITIIETPSSIDNTRSSTGQSDGALIVPGKPFDDSEFSDFEILVLQDVVTWCGEYTDQQLLDTLHEIDTLWHRMVSKENFAEQFAPKGSSRYIIDFRALLYTDFKKAVFEVAYQSYIEAV